MEGGVGPADSWPPATGNSWRTTDDIQDNWASMMTNIHFVRLYTVFRIFDCLFVFLEH
jgi:hypothetical protein